jgi:O-antigen ligase
VIFHPLTVALRHKEHPAVDAASIVVYVLCALGVGLLTRRRPALGVAALLVLAPFDLARYVGPTTITTLKAGLIGLLVALAFSKPDLAAFRTFPVRLMLAAFAATLLAIVLSALHAQNLGAVVREAFKDGEYLLLFAGAVAAFAADPDDRPFWRTLELAVTLVCFSALAEYTIGAHSGIFLRGHVVPRIAGALEGPNQLAGYFDVILPVLIARALVHRDRLLSAVIVLAIVTDLLTFSRAGIVGVVVGIGVVLIVLRPPGRIAFRYGGIVAIVVLAGIALALHAGVPAGYFTLDQATQVADHLGNRAELWRAAIALWKTSPIVGVGAGNYELDLAQVGLVGVRTHANSVYLQALAELGIVGLFTTLGLFSATIWTLGRSAVRRPLVVGALGATVALAVHQVTDDLFFFPKVATAFWLVTGVAVAEVAARRLFERRRAATYPSAAAPAR